MTYCWVIVEAPWVDAALRVAERGAHDALRVDPLVRVERAVLRGDHRVLDVAGYVGERDARAVLAGEPADLVVAVGVVDERGLRREVLVRVRDVGRGVADRERRPRQQQEPQQPQRGPLEQPSGQAGLAALRARLAARLVARALLTGPLLGGRLALSLALSLVGLLARPAPGRGPGGRGFALRAHGCRLLVGERGQARTEYGADPARTGSAHSCSASQRVDLPE